MGGKGEGGAVGVRALGERTVEFRLAGPGPSFMSGMNRPDSGPQPRHAIGDDWTAPGRQVVSGPFAVAERTDETLVLRRRADYEGAPAGDVPQVDLYPSAIPDALTEYKRNDTALTLVPYTPRL